MGTNVLNEKTLSVQKEDPEKNIWPNKEQMRFGKTIINN